MSATIVITGATNGIGRAAITDLAKDHAHIIFTYRNEDLKDSLCSELKAIRPEIKLEAIYCDFSVLDSIREACDIIQTSTKKIDVLINNAGVVNTAYFETSEGIENTFAVNHLGYFLFTNLLLDLIPEQSGKIINVASAAHAFVKDMQWEDLNYKQEFKMGFKAYGQSKLANILFTKHLSKKLLHKGISVNCVHPGGVNTALGSQNKSMLGKLLKILLKPFFRSPLKGAESILFLARSKDNAVSGEYFVDSKIKGTSKASHDASSQEKLWELSEEMVLQTFDI